VAIATEIAVSLIGYLHMESDLWLLRLS
jgi:hypothetical protein